MKLNRSPKPNINIYRRKNIGKGVNNAVFKYFTEGKSIDNLTKLTRFQRPQVKEFLLKKENRKALVNYIAKLRNENTWYGVARITGFTPVELIDIAWSFRR